MDLLKLAADVKLDKTVAEFILTKLSNIVKTAVDCRLDHRVEMYKSLDAKELAYHYLMAVGEDAVKVAQEPIAIGPGAIESIVSAIKSLGAKSKQGPWWDKWLRIAGLVGGIGLVGIAGKKIQGAMMDKRVEESRKWIKAHHPTLAKDPKFDFYFDSLVEFAPHMAVNPIAALPVLDEMREWGQMSPALVKTLTEIEERSIGRTPNRSLLDSLAAAQRLVS
jgi:hypothetical protein